jgi:predicted dithiol-disulfide oxidoreductase (DUF899 family)
MNYRETSVQLAEYRRQIADIRDRMREVRAAAEPEEMPDYLFTNRDGSVRLSELFAGKVDLIVIHNMGTSCPSCTMWADGFNGIYRHLADRAAFIVSSPDTPAVQKDFAIGRGWRFPMVSHAGTSFAADMGYRSEAGGWLPGISVFRRDANRIVRISDSRFQPGDDFCSLWHIFDHLPGGTGDWQPRFRYA